MEFPLTLWPIWFLQNLASSVMLREYHSQMFFSAMKQEKMQKNGTSYPLSGLVFSIAR
jgi:hypothetical protein